MVVLSKRRIRHTLEGPSGLALAFILLASMATNFAETAIGLPLLLAAVVLAYVSERAALCLLMGSAFLPYVGGLPLTAGYVLILALAPSALKSPSELRRLPRPFALLAGSAAPLAVALYPFTRAADTPFLAMGLIAAVEACLIARRLPDPPVRLLMICGIGLAATLVWPFAFNAALGFASPYWFETQTGLLLEGRVTVSVFEPNVVGAFLATGATVLILCAKFRGVPPLAQIAYIALILAVMGATVVNGSRIAVAFLGLAVLVVLVASFAAPGATLCRRSVCLTATVVLAVSAVALTTVSLINPVFAAGVARVVETPSFEATGRPKSIRDSLDTLASVPIAPIDRVEYAKETARYSPHFSLLAMAIFLGVPVTVFYFALLSLPIVSTFLAPRMGDLYIGVALTCLFGLMLLIPQTVDRGVMVLTGLWYARATFAPAAAREAATAK